MYSKSLITIFATVVTVASALPSSVEFLNRHRRNAIPTQFQARGYAQDADLLEPYDQYHERYLSFECQNKHNTAFWDQCCHPVLSWQNAKTDLPSTCWDAPSSGNGDGDGDDCDDGDDGSNPGDDDGDDGDCDDGDDGDAPTTTKAPSNPGSQPTTTKIVTVTKTTTQSAPTTTSGGGDGGNSGGDWNGPGYGTWYKQNGNAGACGIVHGEDDLIVAIDIERYGDTGRVSSLCGKKVFIKNTDNGKTVTATIQDVCPTCVAPKGGQVKNSIDMSLGTFQKLADLATGQITIEWKFV